MSKKALFARWARRTFTRRKVTAFLIGLLRLLFILSICYIILSPLITKVSMSFMDKTDIYDRTVKIVPKHFTLANYPDAVGYADYFTVLGQTLILCLIVTITQVFSCILAGYGFARFKFKGRGFLFALVIVLMVIPTQVLITPQYLNLKQFGLVGSLAPFILLGITGVGARCGLYIFLARQYFRGIPKEIDEAAMIDGAGPYKVFSHIMLKSAVPTMVTIGLFSFVWQWGENSYTPMFYSTWRTVASTLKALGYSMQQKMNSGAFSFVSMVDYDAYYTVIYATLTILTVVPLVILYIFSQRFFMESIENTGIVG